MSTTLQRLDEEIDKRKFTSKEFHEIERLKATMNARGATTMDKQIAEAKLDDLVKSKEPLPHNHKHRIASLEGESGVGSNTLYRQDEAFEKYEMGNDQGPPRGSKVENQATSDMQSVRLNHHARGIAKTKMEHTFHETLAETPD